MKAQRTRDLLKIFWHGDEVTGLTVYAYAMDISTAQPVFPLEFWADGTQTKASKLQGDGWLVWVWDVRVEKWPDHWINTLRSTLARLIDLGASVAWCGLEGCFADPPDLLSPKAMAGGIYAASSHSTGFICHTNLDGQFQTITDGEMADLRSQLRPVQE